MSHALPRPSALFTLLPLTEEAQAAVDHVNNRHLVSLILDKHKSVKGLDVGPYISSRSRDCLATLGRANCDITIPDLRISKLQCDFQLLPNGVVMLRDRSSRGTSRIWEGNAPSKPFETERQRQIVVTGSLNRFIGMGGTAQKPAVRFELVWHGNIAERLESQFGKLFGQEDHPELARTYDDLAPTAQPSMPATRIHTPARKRLSLRFVETMSIGKGSFGEVSQAIDIDSGALIAVKTIKVLRTVWKLPNGREKIESEARWRERWRGSWYNIKREIENLSRLHHV